MSGILKRLSAWLHATMPKREELEENRFVAPLARRSELWRFTRRSVPRGVAIGLLVGIFALIPGVQIVGAALMCVPCRCNIPIAAAMTFLSNPGTTPFILIASAWVGNSMGYHADLATLQTMMGSTTFWPPRKTVVVSSSRVLFCQHLPLRPGSHQHLSSSFSAPQVLALRHLVTTSPLKTGRRS